MMRTRPAPDDVPGWRLHLLRAMYALVIVGLASVVWPQFFGRTQPWPLAAGVKSCMMVSFSLLSVLGLRYPLQMLPLLMFELVWKTIWLLDFGLAQWMSGQRPPTFAEDMFNIALGVILMPLVIPWPYVWRHYVKQAGDRWR